MTRAILTLIAAVAFAAAPFVTSPFSGFTADQLPIPQVDPPIQPAGWAFSIWGLIYAWLIASAVYGVMRRSDAADWNAARPPLIAALALGTPYLWVANQSAAWSTVLIVAMLATALWALFKAPPRDKWWFQSPVAIFAGWLTAATYVSLASVGAGYGVLTDAYGWAFIGIGAALLLGAAVQELLRRAPEYSAPIIWALIGIIATNGTANLWISLFALGGIVALAVVAWRAFSAAPIPAARI